jgi:hypothetical protein
MWRGPITLIGATPIPLDLCIFMVYSRIFLEYFQYIVSIFKKNLQSFVDIIMLSFTLKFSKNLLLKRFKMCLLFLHFNYYLKTLVMKHNLLLIYFICEIDFNFFGYVCQYIEYNIIQKQVHF